MNEVMVIK